MDATKSIQTAPSHLPHKRAAHAAILGGFVVTGVVTTLLGPLLPVLIGRWSLSDQRAGLFFTFQFGSSMVGVVSLSALIPRWGYKFTLVAGFVAISFGMAGLNGSSQFGGLAATALFGYGLGLVLSGSNLWVAEAAQSRRVAALSILNFAWGIGAIACAPLVLIAQNHRAIPVFLDTVAALALTTALILTAVNLDVPPRKTEATESLEASASKMGTIALAALFYLYVGAENSVAGWAAALTKRTAARPTNLWALAPMFFWGGLLAGRAFVPFNPLREREKALAATGLIMGLAGSVILLAVRTFWGVAICVAVTGLGFAAIYPVLVAWMAKHFGERARRVGSLLFALAGLGGATMPSLVGLVSTREGSLRAGLLVPVALCLVMLALLLLIPSRVSS
jgi:MFS transporter, FHS family, glucose/mannose:H+ symporter